MPIENLKKFQVQILTWVVWALIFILSGVTAYQQVLFMDMPENYVRLERYKCDQDKLEKGLSEIKSDTRDIRQLLDKIYVKVD